jgi:hypothetical protein
VSHVASTNVYATVVEPRFRDAINVRSAYWYVLDAG